MTNPTQAASRAGPDLRGRVAIVTGGAGGIGRVLVDALLEAGAHAAVVDVARASLADLGNRLAERRWDQRFLPLEMDVSDPAACEEMVARTIERFDRVDILINNAAIGMGTIRTDHLSELVEIHEVTPEIWRRFIDVNLSGAFYATRAVMPRLLEQGWGRIVNITTSFHTMLSPGFTPYGPAKAGLEAMSAAHAKEFASSGVTVNVVVPGGPTDTPMVPAESGFQRSTLIRPARMAPPIVWLCSEAADAVTGNRYVAAGWDPDLGPDEAASRAGAPIGWPELAGNVVWPAGTPIV